MGVKNQGYHAFACAISYKDVQIWTENEIGYPANQENPFR